MMGKKAPIVKQQAEILCLNQLVLEDHLVLKLDKAIDLSFIYDKVFTDAKELQGMRHAKPKPKGRLIPINEL